MATVATQENKKLVKACANDLRIAPRKLRLVSNMVKGMRVVDALTQLEYTNKKAAPIVSKLLKSAVANAEHNFSLNADDLFIKSITCDMGRVLKRYFPRARGSAFIIRRKMSHLNVVLEEKTGGKKKSRFHIPKKAQIKEEKSENEVMTAEVVESNLPKRSVPKASEQVKANQVQNKRRMFNRKNGE